MTVLNLLLFNFECPTCMYLFISILNFFGLYINPQENASVVGSTLIKTFTIMGVSTSRQLAME
ncbi:hypothetical protein U0070_008459 [Myodes glareolus]|uniref:ATP synthase F0 subunit 6 n=1 Tax=Myodes glareolus TaxID=447135 RepID=A0AAW0I5R7_MYOGA